MAFIVEPPRTSIQSTFMVVLSLAFVIGLALASWWFRSPGSLPVASQLKTRSGTVSEASVTGTDVVFKLHGGSEEYHYAGPQLEEVRAAVYRDASVSILFESAEDAIASGRKIRGTFATVYGVEANDKPVVSYLGQRRHYDPEGEGVRLTPARRQVFAISLVAEWQVSDVRANEDRSNSSGP